MWKGEHHILYCSATIVLAALLQQSFDDTFMSKISIEW